MGQNGEGVLVSDTGKRSVVERAGAVRVPSLQRMIVPLVLALAASVVVMALAARSGSFGHAAGGAGLFVVLLVAVAAYINVPLWQSQIPASSDGELLTGALRRNARLIALVYVWGSAAMLTVYTLTGLKWQHGWQYGTAMALIAGVHLWYVHEMGNAKSWLRTAKGQDLAFWLGVLHGTAALGALAFLVLSGKLELMKPDWVANQVFLFGLIALIAITDLGTITHIRLARSAAAAV